MVWYIYIYIYDRHPHPTSQSRIPHASERTQFWGGGGKPNERKRKRKMFDSTRVQSDPISSRTPHTNLLAGTCHGKKSSPINCKESFIGFII